MQRMKFAIIAGLLLAGLGFCFNWRPHDALLSFASQPLMLFIFSLLLLSIFESPGRRAWSRMIDAPAGYWIAICCSFTFIACTSFALGPLEAIPHAFDDVGYLWMAKTFTMGRLWMESHDLPEFFHQFFFINDGRWYPLFQPGWPALLMLGVLSGLEFFINPLLAALAVALSYFIGRRIFDESIARLAMAIMAVSQIHLFLGSFLFAHPLSLVLTQLSVLLVLRLYEKESLKDLLILAFALGWLFTTRAMNAVTLMAVIGITLLVFLFQKRIAWWRLLAAAPIALSFLGLQLAYNHALTGEALSFPQERYFALTEENPECHRLGFGEDIGCPNIHGTDSFPQGFGFKEALVVTHQRMGFFLISLLGWSFLLIFIGAPFLSGRFGWRATFLLSVFLSLIAGYFFFYYHGVGGRYYYESGFVLLLLIAAGVVETRRGTVWLSLQLPAGFKHAKRPLLALAPAAALTFFLFNLVFYMPAMPNMMKNFFGVDRRIEKMTNGHPQKSVYFLEDSFPAAFVHMSPGLPETKRFVHDYGLHNRQIMQYYPDWNFYKYDPDKKAMLPLEKHNDPSKIFIEAEFKSHSIDTSGETMNVEVCDEKGAARCSGGAALIFKAAGPSSYAAFKQYVFVDGRYDLSLDLLTAADRGRFSLSIDDKNCGEVAELYAKERGLKSWQASGCSSIPLTKGMHRFAFEIAGKHPDSAGFTIAIDSMELNLVTEGR